MMPGENVEIDCRHEISSIAFPDAEHILTSCRRDGIIRRWRTSDGRQVEPEIDTGSEILSIAASDEWIVAGTRGGAIVWNAKTYAKSAEIQKGVAVRAVDISLDSSKVAALSKSKLVVVSDIDGDRRRLLPLWSADVEVAILWRVGLWILSLAMKFLAMWLVIPLVIPLVMSLSIIRWAIHWASPLTISLENLPANLPEVILVLILLSIPLLLLVRIRSNLIPGMPVGPRMPRQLDVKFSPDGSRIATFSEGPSEHYKSIRVSDAVDGKELSRIKAITPVFAWTRNSQQLHVVLSDKKIASVSASNGSSQFQCTWEGWDPLYIIAAPRNNIIISRTSSSLFFWDFSTKSRIGPVIETKPYSARICLSPDGLYLACTGGDNRITIQCLRQLLPHHFLFGESPQEDLLHDISDEQRVAEEASGPHDGQNNSFQSSSPIHASQLPLLRLSDAVFAPWIQGDLARAQGILEEEINSFSNSTHYALAHYAFANRAFIRARQRNWKGAQEDANKSLECRHSVVGLIAKSIALVGLGRQIEAFTTFDLVLTQCNGNEIKLLLLMKYIIFCMAKRHNDAVAHVTTLMDLADTTSIYPLVQAQMYLQLGDWYVDQNDYEHAIQSFARARVPLVLQNTEELQVISLIFGWCFKGLRNTIRVRLRNTLSLALRRTQDLAGAESRLRSGTAFSGALAMTAESRLHTSEHLERLGDEASNSNKQEKEILYYTAALFLNPPTYNTLLEKWANAKLSQSSWEATLNTAIELKIPEYLIYQVMCDILKRDGRLHEATECFCKMEKELQLTMVWCGQFKKWLANELTSQVDGAAAATLDHSDAIQLTSLGRSKVLALAGKWEAALRDADKAIDLDPSSHLGYESRHRALFRLRAKNYEASFEAYEMMYAKPPLSSDQYIDSFSRRHISPSKIDETIRRIVESTIRNTPSVLINTTTGRLRDKSQQASEFAATPVCKELRASMTTQIDDIRIKKAVKKYYEYAMFSHTWEHGVDPEPSFQLLERTTAYELQKTITNDKLQQFCSLARDLGYFWAWSDTCCIDQLNQVVLQESLVSMFRWYHGSAMTIVFLREAAEELESLEKSFWNTRVWTYQEYVAAEVIRFYTKGWKPYRGLMAPMNHKQDEVVRKELESNTANRSARALQPDLENIREKLRLASNRNTTREEDIAYSLFGIFNISMPVIYGEGGSAALGRLLAHLLTASGDASILAWTGKSGSFNSCFPVDITVFEHLATPHLPVRLDDDEMQSVVDSPRSSLDHALELSMLRLYDRLNELTVPSFAANRMKLPCNMFELGPLLPIQTDTVTGRLYRANTVLLGEVDIQTNEDLLRLGPLYLVHPWLNAILPDRDHQGGATKRMLKLPALREGEKTIADFEATDYPSPLPQPPSFPGPLPIDPSGEPLDELTRARRLVTRLRQKFGALLLTYTDLGYRRVASDALISVQVKENLGLKELIENLDIRTVDIL